MPKNLAVLILLVLACMGQSQCEVKNNRVVFLGDSITQADPGFVGMIEAPSLDIRNAGCGATTTASWLQRHPEPSVGLQCGESFVFEGETLVGTDAFGLVFLPHMPSARVVIMLGVNDARFHGAFVGPPNDEPIPPTEYDGNLKKLIAWVFQNGAARVAIVKPWANQSAYPAEAWIRLVEFRARIDALPDEFYLADGPDPAAILSASDFEADGVHWTASGHQKFADAMETFLATWE